MTTINTPYEDLLQEILDNGNRKEDRTGTGTISLFGKQLRWDLSQGFPLITTKKVAWKAVRGELLWFINGDTNNKSLQEDNIKIWNEWAEKDGSLGSIYGSSWRSWPDKNNSPIIEIEKRKDTNPNYHYTISPEDTTLCDIAIIGDTIINNDNKRLYDLWVNMIQQCYDPAHKEYLLYGDKGYTVSSQWLEFSNFEKTISIVPGYAQWSRHKPLKLSAQYYGSTVFSPDTTVFLEENDNSILSDTIIEVNGDKFEDYDELLCSGKYNDYPVSSIKSITARDGYVWRRRRYIDQLSQVIEQIKNNPDSRRLLVNSWNVSELENMALPPCHLLFQFYVADGKLSCQLYQRSADMFLGVPFNIASYSLLTHMIAQQAGLEVGEFVWTGGDCHIYTNHIDQVKEQLSREAKPYPQLELNHRDSIYDYTINDAQVVGYDPHPTIKAPVSV